MRAIVLREFGGPENLRAEEMPVPVPAPDEALIKVAACGVCNEDAVIRRGVMRIALDKPLIMGHEISGEVVEVGRDVRDIKVGDRVITKNIKSCGRCYYCRTADETHCERRLGIQHGGYGELAVIPEESLLRLPPEIPFEEGAIFGCAIGSALRAVKDAAHVVLRDTVLVTGPGGGIGIHCVQIARLAGARVIAATGSPDKMEKIKALGADSVILTKGAFHEEVLDLTGGKGVSVVLDTVGSTVFPSAFRALGYRGRYVAIGEFQRQDVHFNLAWLKRKMCVLTGNSAARKHEVAEVIRLVQEGKVKPVVSHTLPLERIADAHRMIEERRAFGRIVVKPEA